MAGDLLLTSKLIWPASSSLYQWVLDFLLTQAERPGALAVLREADEFNLGMVDFEEIPVDDRDELYRILRDRLVPGAAAHIPTDAEYRETYLAEFGKLADLAAVAWDRHHGQEIADHTIVVASGANWRTTQGMYTWVLTFLAEHASESVASVVDKARVERREELDLTALEGVQRDELLALLRDELVASVAAKLPAETVGRERYLGKLQELADAARDASAG